MRIMNVWWQCHLLPLSLKSLLCASLLFSIVIAVSGLIKVLKFPSLVIVLGRGEG